jgi:hypothetical protein
LPVDHRPAELDDLAQELRLIAALGSGTIVELCGALDRVSEDLNGHAHRVGLDDPLSRELLGLRTRIGSFVLAAQALDDAQTGSARVVALLRRAVDQTIDELIQLSGPTADAHRLGRCRPTGDRYSSNS